MKERSIYFMKPVALAGPIKIGCSYLPNSRLVALSVWSPFELEIIASVPGDFTLERKLHNLFAESRTHREWFRPTKALLSGIAALRAGVPVNDAFGISDNDEQAMAVTAEKAA